MATDYTIIPTPDYVYGNSQDILTQLVSNLQTDTTDIVNSKFCLANYAGVQTINTQHNFANGVLCPSSPTQDNNLCKRRWVKNNFLDLDTPAQSVTANKNFNKIYMSELLNINENAELNLVGNITANSVTITPNEISRINGLTSNAQTQIDGKQNSITSATNLNTNNITVNGNLTTHNAINSNGNLNSNGDLYVNGNLIANSQTVSDVKLSYLSTLSSNVQTQLNSKINSSDAVDISSVQTITGTKTINNLNSATQLQGDNSTKVSTTAYVDTAISNLVGSSPSLLNTLQEINTAINNDANFHTTITNQISAKANDNAVVHLTGNETIGGIKTFSSAPVLSGSSIEVGTIPDSALISSFVKPSTSPILDGTNISNIPQSAIINLSTDLGNKTTLSAVQSNNNVFTGTTVYNTSLPTSTLTPSLATELTTKAYVDSVSGGGVSVSSNNTWTGTNAFNTSLPTSTLTPSSNSQLTTKVYVDSAISNASFTPTNGSITDAMLQSTFVKPSTDFTSGSITLDTNKTLNGISATTLSYVDPTSSIQTQLNSKINSSDACDLTSIQTITGQKTINNLISATQTQGDNSTKVSTTAYVDTAISNLIGSSPSLLNTLQEINTAINNDPDFATTVTNQIATKANDNAVVHLTGNETVAGIKTFSSPPILSGASITTATIPDSALVSTFLKAATDFTSGSITLDTGKTLNGISSTILSYLSTISSNVQTQLNGKQATITNGSITDAMLQSTFVKASTDFTSGSITLDTGKTLNGITATTLSYLDPTSSIQTQLNGKYTMPAGSGSGNFIYYNGSSWVASTDGKVRLGTTCGSATQGTGAICIGTLCGNHATYPAGADAIFVGRNVGWNFASACPSNVIGIGNDVITNVPQSNVIAIGSASGYQQMGQYSIALGTQTLRNGGNRTNVIAIGQNAMYNGANNGAIAIGLGALQNSTTGLATVCIGQECGNFSNAGNYAIALGYRCGYATNALPANSITLNASGSAFNPSTASAFYVNPVRQDTATTNSICFYNTTTKEVSYNTTIDPSLIASNPLSITTLNCSSITNTGGLSSANSRKIINSIGHTSTNNFTLNFSSGDFFCLTSNAPTANFTIRLNNVGTDTGKTIKFTVLTNTAFYCNTITCYSDNGTTQITLSSSTPLYNGMASPSVGGATVVRQTFEIIRSFASNYCLSEVVAYA